MIQTHPTIRGDRLMVGQIDSFGLSHVGSVRASNEDHYLLADLANSIEVLRTNAALDQRTRLFSNHKVKLMVVADGMGGHAGGQRASALAISGLAEYALNRIPWCPHADGHSDGGFMELLKRATEHAHLRIRAEAESSLEVRGMGTTLTVAGVVWPHLYVVHVGDSRCYLHRRGRLRQLTQDHTVEQRLGEAGLMKGGSGEASRWSRMLWNVLGGSSDDVAPEVHRLDIHVDDTLLLCTDGLTRHVGDAEIAGALATAPSAEHACRRLVEQALARGGRDNVTVVVASFRRDTADMSVPSDNVFTPRAERRVG